MQILITGGSGFVGSELAGSLKLQGNKIIILTRDRSKTLPNATKTVNNLDEIASDEQIDVIVNLAGAPIDKIWTATYKQILIDSRVITTQKVIALISRLEHKPQLLISASAIGYYGHHEDDDILDEGSKPNDEFTHELCNLWEQAALRAKEYGVRTCITRLGVVLGKGGGMLKKVITPFKFGLGGKIGTGEQPFSWVHVEDVIEIFKFLMKNKNLEGVYNLTSPHPVTNLEFTAALGESLHRPTFFSISAFVIKLVFREMGETLLLKGSRVISKRLAEAGYCFKFSKIKDALENIVR